MNDASRSLRRLGFLLNASGLTDGQLWEQFRAHQNEAAFEVLMRRHGPMVLGVCRRILRNVHDADDAFQATFLVLARKAKSITPIEMIANWLYGVAYRTARKAKAHAAKIQAREQTMPVLPERSQGGPASLSDLEVLLDQELNRLPDKYRAPIVLCELEGRTHKEVARQLGWPEGTLSVRLMKAKKILANRLAGRNMGPGGALLSALLCVDAASANVPPTLLAETAKNTILFAASPAAAAGVLPVKVLALTNGVLKSMLLTKVKHLLTVLVLVGFLGTGAVYSTQLLVSNSETIQRADPATLLAHLPERPKNDRPDARKELPRADATGALPAGALARIGSLAFRTEKARGAVMAPNGRTLFIGSPKGIQLFDLESGLFVRTFAGTSASEGRFVSFAISADGTLLAANSEKAGGAFLWDTTTGQRLRPLETTRLTNATFRADGKKLVVPGPKGVCVLDVASGKEEFRLVEDQAVSQILLTPDGETLITASQMGNSIYVTDMRSKKLIRSLHAEEARAPLVALSPDGKTLAVTDSRKAGIPPRDVCTMRFVDLASGQHRAVDMNEVPQRRYMDLLYSPDGRSVLVSPALSKSCIIDVASGKATEQVPYPSSAKFHFTPDSRRLVIFDNKIIRVWDLANARELHPPEGPTAIAERLAFSPDGSILASVLSSPGSPIYCWNAGTGQLLAKIDDVGKGLLGEESNVSFAPDGRLISSGKNGVIRVWDAATFAQTSRFDVPDQDKGPLSVATDGRTVASFAFPTKQPAPALRRTEPKEQAVRLFAWDLATGRLLDKSDVWAAMHRNLPQLSPDGKRYITLSGADICLKETRTNKELVKLKPNPQPDAPDTLDPNYLEGPASFSTDGQTAALSVSRLRQLKGFAAGFKYHIIVFDLASGKEHCRIPVEGFRPQPFALAPDGRRVAGVTGATARIWDAVTGEFLWEVPAIGVEITAVAFSADGNRLATALSDTTILVWDVRLAKRRESKQP